MAQCKLMFHYERMYPTLIQGGKSGWRLGLGWGRELIPKGAGAGGVGGFYDLSVCGCACCCHPPARSVRFFNSSRN